MNFFFSPSRLWAIMRKEFILMKRDPAVIAIMAILPLILVCIAGYAINIYPKKVPTVLMNYDNSDTTNQLIEQMKNSGYFSFVRSTHSEKEASHLLKKEESLLVLVIPPDFTYKFLRHQTPELLIEDGSVDEISTGRAIATLSQLTQFNLQHIEPGPLKYLEQNKPAFQIVNHRLYDPDRITQYYIVPGTIGLILMLTMLMITTVIAFRDIQGGIIDYLLASPTRPSEILIGEILTYIFIGYIQLFFGLLLSYYLFDVPFVGSLGLLLLCTLPYIIAQLSMGLTIATFCSTQFEAVQVVNLFIAFSIILTGFNFPIFGMPEWGQTISLFLPLTYFFKIIFGIMLKGNNFYEIWPNLWPLLVYCMAMIVVAVFRFKYQFR